MEERYLIALERIESMPRDGDVLPEFREYFDRLSGFILKAVRGFSPEIGAKELERANRELFSDLSKEGYKNSYLDPEYAARRLGSGFGSLLSMFYAELMGLPGLVREGKKESVTILMETFIQLYNLFEAEEAPTEKEVRDLLYSYLYDYCGDFTAEAVFEELNGASGLAYDIVTKADLSDPSYLYLFGEMITESELETSMYLSRLPEERIKLMASALTEGYIRGFEVTGRDIKKKSTVGLVMPLGFERMFREVIKNFEAAGLKPVIRRRGTRLIEKRSYGSSRKGFFGHINEEFEYDHRNDEALFWGARLKERKLESLRNAYEENREAAGRFSGTALCETFGEESFSPRSKENELLFSDYQEKLRAEYRREAAEIVLRFMPEEETSFAIIAWPVPDIGGDYLEILDEMIEINTLPCEKYYDIQKGLTDALDKACYIEMKGSGENRTDLRIMLHELKDRARETNFENCLADVNIPLGEVFTSPVLEGTCGRLNVSSVYIGGILFRDLTIDFEDGRVKDYCCGNFPDDRERGRRLIEDVIFKNKKALPMGEFAIGTNTTAYMAAKRLDISSKLPILIAEKTGPHIAVGDTCYSHAEELAVFNPDGKEITARSNECADLRDTEPEKAYFDVHCDVTVPYDEVGLIRAVAEDGSFTDIIREGRFVLPEALELNIPFYK